MRIPEFLARCVGCYLHYVDWMQVGSRRRNMIDVYEKFRGHFCGHFMMKCSECDKVLAQCRCMDKDKHEVFIVCKECRRKEEI